MSTFIPFALPDIGEEEIQEVVDTLRSGWITTGPKVKKFEENFAKYIGCKHAIAVNSATSGLHLSLDAIGLKRGDKVITTTYTFTATAEVIRYFDADPILCDIDPKTYNLDVHDLERLLQRHCQTDQHKVRAIIPVHMAGQACDMQKILKLAEKYQLKVIEDAAHALPTTHQGQLVGTLGDITVFSFYATKTLATGEGGMVVTNSDEFAKRMNIMRIHGFSRDAWKRYQSKDASWYYEVVAPGFKYNMTDMAAALGLQQLKKIDTFYERRNQIAQLYDSAFAKLEGIKTPYRNNNQDKHAFHLYLIQIDPNKRDEFIEKMKRLGIGCSVHFIPLHLHPYWKEKYNFKSEDFPKAFETFKASVSLPIYTKMTDEDVKRVVEAVSATLRE